MDHLLDFMKEITPIFLGISARHKITIKKGGYTFSIACNFATVNFTGHQTLH